VPGVTSALLIIPLQAPEIETPFKFLERLQLEVLPIIFQVRVVEPLKLILEGLTSKLRGTAGLGVGEGDGLGAT